MLPWRNIVFPLLLAAHVEGQHDQTVQPGAKGAEVVEATLDKIDASCVFPADNLLTRRMAYVESYDGMDQGTFRPGYYGGIWQMDQQMFDLTHSQAQFLAAYIEAIRIAFAIDWTSITWLDLTKPLHSALGARLYMTYTARNVNTGIPGSIEDQATYWVNYYKPSRSRDEFITEASSLEQGCAGSNGADLIFVLDSSGSIGDLNFELIRAFVKDVVNEFDIGMDVKQYRIGVIEYSSAVSREFDLNTHATKADVLQAIDRIQYDAGGTNTHLALDEMVQRGFTPQNGARPIENGHPRVGIVVTDGQSNDPPATIEAARRAHAADITMFAVGVGTGVNMNELQAIASDPTCIHLILLQSFTEFGSLKHIIEKRTCDAPIIISPGSNSSIEGSIPPGDDQNCKIKIPAEGSTIKLAAYSGSVTFYISQTTYPSSSYYDDMVEAYPDRMGVMFIPQPPTSDLEGIMFCNIKGDNYTESNISIGSNPGNTDHCKHAPCLNSGVCINTPDSYRCECQPGFTGNLCDAVVTTTTNSLPTSTSPECHESYNCDTNNPCTPDLIALCGLYFAHDNSTSQFVQCAGPDLCYDLHCKPGLVWNVEEKVCDWP